MWRGRLWRVWLSTWIPLRTFDSYQLTGGTATDCNTGGFTATSYLVFNKASQWNRLWQAVLFTELTGWKEEEEEEGGEDEEETGVIPAAPEPLGANGLCTLVVRAFRCECVCINQHEYMRPVKSITPSEQALHQAAPVSLECVQTKTSETAKFLRVGVIADQIKCLWAQAPPLLNHKVTINRAVGGHKKVSLAFYAI